MSTQHSTITDSERHEAKGASTAANGTACFANGDGTTTFRQVAYADLSTKPTSSGYKQELLVSSVAATQTPAAADTLLQVEFGPATSTSNVSLSTAGALTFTTAGEYVVRYGLSVSGGTAGTTLYIRVLLNGSSLEPTHRVQVSANNITSYNETIALSVNAGDVLTLQIVYDSTGAGAGGLKQAAPTISGWSAAPTAGMTICKFKGIN